MKYEDLNERAKKDIIKTTKKVINFIDKYGIESIKFTDVSYFDCDDIFDDETPYYVRVCGNPEDIEEVKE